MDVFAAGDVDEPGVVPHGPQLRHLVEASVPTVRVAPATGSPERRTTVVVQRNGASSPCSEVVMPYDAEHDHLGVVQRRGCLLPPRSGAGALRKGPQARERQRERVLGDGSA